MKRFFSILGITFLSLAFLGISPHDGYAATLFFSPTTGSYDVGQRFSVSIHTTSAEQAMNAASGVVSFPTDLLEVTSLSKSSSIFSLWVLEPSFSNSKGVVSFEGIVLNPGFIGSGGKIITIEFRAKAAGLAHIRFSSGTVLANDGKGTNILIDLGNAQFSVGIAEAPPPPVQVGTPGTPAISSPTHPDQNSWYALSDAEFTWPLSSDITGTRLLVDKNSRSTATITHVPPISSRKLTEIDDGVWFFHARLQNAQGWGSTSHFRLQIDTQKPDFFTIKEASRNDKTDPQATFIFDAHDETSGIDHYEIQVNGEELPNWEDDGSHQYATPPAKPGEHKLLVKAVDKAGNYLIDSTSFTVESIEPPVITDYPQELQSGEVLVVRGTTKYPGAQVTLWVKGQEGEAISQEAKSDEQGGFRIIVDKSLKNDVYTLWARVTDGRGAISNPSEEVQVIIGPSAFLRIGSLVVGVLTIVVSLLALIVLLVLLLWYGWYKIRLMRERLRKEVNEADRAVSEGTKTLRSDMHKVLQLLLEVEKRRMLNLTEQRLKARIEKDIKEVEQRMKKEIEDVKREVK